MSLNEQWKTYRLPEKEDIPQIEEQLSADLKDVELLEDPVKRIFALQRLKDAIYEEWMNATDGIYERANSVAGSVAFLGFIAACSVPIAVGSLMAVSSAGGGLAVLALGLAIVAGSMFVYNKILKSITKKLTPQYADHAKKLESLQASAGARMDAEVKNNVKVIQKLPLQDYDSVMKLPGVSEQFTAAVKASRVYTNEDKGIALPVPNNNAPKFSW